MQGGSVGVASSHSIERSTIAGFPCLGLVSGAGLRARFVPGAGMVCASLEDRGVELLGQRAGLAAYAARGDTLGIPLLHPWANRLARRGFDFDGLRVRWPEGARGFASDAHGLPLHGLMAGARFDVLEHGAGPGAARLVAELDFAADPARAALFPFPHLLRIEAELAGRSLRIATALRASGARAVPVAFGWHPWLRLPGVPRAAWQIGLPVGRRLRLDARCLPTGEHEAVAFGPAPLGTRCFDDLFDRLVPGRPFVLAGGGRRLELAFGPGYDHAVVYAPADDDVVCFEPMTAPTNPFDGGFALRTVEPGACFEAAFTLSVREAG
jgi:galactose mutarotase-like enzyme